MNTTATQPTLFHEPAHVGRKGEKFTCELRLLSRYERPVDSPAPRFKYTFITPDGNTVIWDTDVEKEIPVGWEGTVTFVVKSFSRKGKPKATKIKSPNFSRAKNGDADQQ